MRLYAALGAFLGWFALALQLYLMLVQAPAAMLGAVITYFSFFTILTNFLVALVFTAAAIRPRAPWGQWVLRPSVQASTAVYIAIVGIVYQLLLRHLWNPQGEQWVADVLLHSVIPVGYVLYWWLFAPRDELSWKNADRLVGLSRSVPGLYTGTGRGERPLPLSFCRRKRARLRRRAHPGCRTDVGIPWNGPVARGDRPLEAKPGLDLAACST